MFAAIASNGAWAANEFKETGGAWYVSGSKLTEGTTNTLTTKGVGTQKLESTIAGVKTVDSLTGVECVGCTIRNTGATATIDGNLKFTGFTAGEPVECRTPSTVETKTVAAIVGMNSAGTLATLKFTPKEGTSFATIELSGEKCAIAGLYKLNGTIFMRTVNATGVFAVNQELTTRKAIQESAGTATSLTFGESGAILTDAVKGTLGGSPNGAPQRNCAEHIAVRNRGRAIPALFRVRRQVRKPRTADFGAEAITGGRCASTGDTRRPGPS